MSPKQKPNGIQLNPAARWGFWNAHSTFKSLWEATNAFRYPRRKAGFLDANSNLSHDGKTDGIRKGHTMNFAAAAARFDQGGSNIGTTTNGAATNLTSLSACVDFFGQAPAMRGKDAQAIILFDRAYAENKEVALRTLLWLRDVRGGAGERQLFRSIVQHLCATGRTPEAAAIIQKTPEVGRWDDLFAFAGPVRHFALAFYTHALSVGNDRLAAKWAPRKGVNADALRASMALGPRDYRKHIVALSDTVEQKMCAREWGSINFSHVPSVAARRYQKAFNRRAAQAYAAYKEALKRNDGSAKVNASAIFPHDVLSGVMRGDATVAEHQWKALPDYLGGAGGILALVDMSGSMDAPLGGYTSGSLTTCADVAAALGIYTAERLTGAFRNLVMTFSATARVVHLNDTMSLGQKREAMYDGYMGNTNIEAAFRKILEIAVTGNVKSEDMPKRLLILSDMEFDQATSPGLGVRTASKRAMDMVTAEYAKAGYARPQIVFWNLNARLGNVPVTVRDDGTALVGGYSPALFKAILAGDNMTPEGVMMAAVGGERYAMNV